MTRGQQRHAHDGRHLSIILWLISLFTAALNPISFHHSAITANTPLMLYKTPLCQVHWPCYLPASSERLVWRHDDRCRYWFSASIACVIIIAGILVARAYRQFGWWLCPTENKQVTIFCLLWLKINICISRAHLLRHTETHSHSLGYTCT